MTDPSRYPDAGGIPRWVKVAGIIVIVVALLVAVMLLVGGGGGGHSPRRHAAGGDTRISRGVTNTPCIEIQGQTVNPGTGPEAEVAHRGTCDPGQ